MSAHGDFVMMVGIEVHRCVAYFALRKKGHNALDTFEIIYRMSRGISAYFKRKRVVMLNLFTALYAQR